MADQTLEVTLGDKTVELSTVERYKGRAKQTDRIAIISTKLQRSYSFFHNNRLFRAPTNPDTLKRVKDALQKEPEQRFGLTLFQYTVFNEGENAGKLIDPTKCQGRVKVWVVSETRYTELSNINGEWPLLDNGFAEKQVDLKIVCTEEKFQRMNFMPISECHWKSKEAWYKALKDKEQKVKPSLQKALGAILPDAEVIALIGAAPTTAPGSVANAQDIDLSDIVDEVS